MNSNKNENFNIPRLSILTVCLFICFSCVSKAPVYPFYVDLTGFRVIDPFRYPLHYLASRGESSVLHRLIIECPKFNCADDYGITPIHLATPYPCIVDILIQAGSGLVSKGELYVRFEAPAGGNNHMGGPCSSEVPLYASLRKDLMFPQFSPNFQKPWFVTPLHRACESGVFRSVALIVSAGGVVDPDPDMPTVTPLHFAVLSGSLRIINFLLDHGARIDGCDRAGDTPLHYAVWEENIDALRLLISRGANSFVCNFAGLSPKCLATATNRFYLFGSP